jgi:single-strand DNA-binding protein
MAGINKVILVGNVGTDPEVRSLEGGNTKAKFRLATTEIYKDKDGNRVEHTEWHNIVAWRSLADIVGKYIKKGNQVFIEGKLRTRQWEDKDGIKKQITEIVAETINLLGKRETDSRNTNSNTAADGVNPNTPNESTTFNDYLDSDLPF